MNKQVILLLAILFLLILFYTIKLFSFCFQQVVFFSCVFCRSQYLYAFLFSFFEYRIYLFSPVRVPQEVMIYHKVPDIRLIYDPFRSGQPARQNTSARR